MKVKRKIFQNADMEPFFNTELLNATISMKHRKSRAIINLSDYRDDVGQREEIEINLSQDELLLLIADFNNLYWQINRDD